MVETGCEIRGSRGGCRGRGIGEDMGGRWAEGAVALVEVDIEVEAEVEGAVEAGFEVSLRLEVEVLVSGRNSSAGRRRGGGSVQGRKSVEAEVEGRTGGGTISHC